MTSVPLDKLPPQNLDAEKSLLGAVLINKDAITKVADSVTPDDFYSGAHQNIYSSMLSVFERRDNVDLLTISNKLQEQGKLEEIGGVSYLTSLANAVPTSAHITTYARIVQRKKVLRNLIDAAHHIIGLGYKEDDDVENLLDEAEQKLFHVSQKGYTQNFATLATSLDEAMERISNQDSGVLRGYATSHKKLDETLGGFQKSDLIIIAARPSVGKTAFAIDLALRVAQQSIPVGVFSLEMSMDQVVDRFIASSSGVSLWKLRTGKLSHDGIDNDFLKITDAISNLKNLPIYIDDASSLNVLQMRAMARRLQADYGIGLLIVDYLQLMASRRNYDSPVQQVTEISRGLKGLAKDLNIPVIAISQLSRAVESREGHKPRLSDLRDSGSIEQDADVVMFIHREDKIDAQRAQDQGRSNLAQLVIAKHRNGPTGEVNFRIDPDSLKFMEVDYIHKEPTDFISF